MSNIPKAFEDAQENLDLVMTKFSDFGAADSEPTWVSEMVIKDYIKNYNNRLPLTGEKWQLFTHSMDCEEATKALNEATQKILGVIDKLSYREVTAIADYYGY